MSAKREHEKGKGEAKMGNVRYKEEAKERQRRGMGNLCRENKLAFVSFPRFFTVPLQQ
jgi:hypothetical protein